MPQADFDEITEKCRIVTIKKTTGFLRLFFPLRIHISVGYGYLKIKIPASHEFLKFTYTCRS